MLQLAQALRLLRKTAWLRLNVVSGDAPCVFYRA